VPKLIKKDTKSNNAIVNYLLQSCFSTTTAQKRYKTQQCDRSSPHSAGNDISKYTQWQQQVILPKAILNFN
jgi:hypothetical protein